MIVLDTNVISELMQTDPDAGVVNWVEQRSPSDAYITAVTAAELVYGAARLPEGQRKVDLTLRIMDVIREDFDERVLPFDSRAAALYGPIVADRERRGAPIHMADAQLAAICRAHGAVLATRNTKDFLDTGIDLADPWSA
jgi:toxin FitB